MTTTAELLEQKYQRYRNLREVAQAVYAPKIEEYENPDYEEICTLVVFSFDRHNQEKVAQTLGVSREQMLYDLILLSTGARLQKQGK